MIERTPVKLAELLAGHPYDLLQGDGNTEITGGLTPDSREVGPGSLFIAVPGRRQDGHAHLGQVGTKGAVAALVSSTQYPFPPGLAVARVADTQEAMSLVAARYFGEPGRDMQVVSITGTNGKTSVAAILESILRTLSPAPVGVVGTGGPRLDGAPVPMPTSTPTTPQAIEMQALLRHMTDQGAGTVVLEASSLALLQHRVDHVFTDVAVFTNLSPDHLDDHGTMAAYRDAKLLLFSGLAQKAVINLDDPVSSDIQVLMPESTTFGIDHVGTDFRAQHIKVTSSGTHFVLAHDGHGYDAHIPVPGLFAVYNALAAVAVCHQLGYAIEPALHVLDTLPQIPGRMETVHLDSGTTVIVDYAHSADSLEKILSTLRDVCTGRIITVFGCGGDRDTTKRAPMGVIAGQFSDHVIITSDNPRSEDPDTIIDAIERGVLTTGTPYERITDRRRAIHTALTLAGAQDTVLVAGKGSEPYQLIGDQVLPFDDMTVVREAAEHQN